MLENQPVIKYHINIQSSALVERLFIKAIQVLTLRINHHRHLT